MNNQILFVGLDVDDTAYHIGLLSKDESLQLEFKCKPTVGALITKLKKYQEKGYELRICYEATYLGFSLCRELRKRGFHCDVIAPSLIPTKPGKKVKTDRLDGKKLARYFRSGDLTVIRVPNEEEEAIRDFIRSRGTLNEKLKSTKLQIIGLCRRQGWQYREPGTKSSYWTPKHRGWLKEQKDQTENSALKLNMALLLDLLSEEEDRVEKYEIEIERIAHLPELWPKVQALCCYRGINILTAMIFIFELGDINRFDHPKRITSFAGMDLTEFSSGGRENKFRMTKMGNGYIRKAAIEACQFALKKPRVSYALKKRREKVDEKLISIADRCHRRLHSKGTRLLYGGKLKNKIKVACARELLCFIWESLRAAA